MTGTGYDPAAAISEAIKTMTPDQAVKTVRELCSQLSSDAEGFHGNIWPENIRLDWEGKAVLGEPSDEPANRREAEQVEYLAPEFFWDNEGSAAADVYSLGMLLYAACSGGYLPFQPRGGLLTAKDRSGALRKRMKGEPIAAPDNITPELAAVIRKALSYEPEDRYISAAELMNALGATDEALPVQPAATVPAEEPENGAEPEPSEAAPGEEPAAQEEVLPEPEAETEAEAESVPEEPSAPQEEAEEASIDDILEAELSFLDLPNAEDDSAEPEPEEKPELKYTVQKDFEEKTTGRTSVPNANRKKKASPVIPVLCVAAVIVIAAAAVLLQGRGRRTPAVSEELTVTYTIEPTLSTAPPAPAEVTPSLGDDEKTVPEETEAVGEQEVTDQQEESESPGSAVIDGMAVEPVSDYVAISDTGANLRIGPGTNYMVAESLSKGVELMRTGTVNGWSQVQYEGNEYYVASNLVHTVEHTEPEAGQEQTVTVSGDTEIVGTVVVTADVNIRSGPGTEYGKVGEAKAGASLTPLGRTADGKWYHISYNGVEGYVNRNLVSAQGYAEITAMSGTLTVTGEVNIRSGPGTGYDILGVAKAGGQLAVTGSTDTGWYRVQYNGRTAYLAREYGTVG